MKIHVPSWTKPAVLGGIVGAIAIGIFAFQVEWVVSKGDAMRQAERQANQEVLSALTPICVTQFRALPESKKQTHLASLKGKDAWDKGAYVEEHGWATMPGSTSPNDDVASACAEALLDNASSDTG